MSRFFGLLVAAIISMLSVPTYAQEYVGGWAHGPGYAVLGDNSDDSGLRLGTTSRYCGIPGSSYSVMNGIMRRNGQSGEQIYWWIDQECSDGYIRICIENRFGESACSTYRDLGWEFY